MKNHVLLISLYELGRQSFSIASAAAFLKEAGATVFCCDLAIDSLDSDQLAGADLVAINLPMHTATQIAVPVIRQIRQSHPECSICCFGLYAPLNAPFLLSLGVDEIIGGEFEERLVNYYLTVTNGSSTTDAYNFGRVGDKLAALPNGSKATWAPTMLDNEPLDIEPPIYLPRLQFQRPYRENFPSLKRYCSLDKGDGILRAVGYTETTRGCKHLCRHCPVVPVYNGTFRVVQKEIVMADIRQQVQQGAEHITFGDPDFLNGPGHGMAIVNALHDEFPNVSYDVTIKVEHLLRYAEHLPNLKRTGCLFITSAIESFDNRVLNRLNKGHTYDDFTRALDLCDQNQLFLHPTFVAFHPWQSLDDYVAFLRTIAELDIVDAIAPIQYAIRLLIPAKSHLLQLDDIKRLVEPFDEQSLVYPWRHPDPAVDNLQRHIISIAQDADEDSEPRRATFNRIWWAAVDVLMSTKPKIDPSRTSFSLPLPEALPTQIAFPKLTEHWYC